MSVRIAVLFINQIIVEGGFDSDKHRRVESSLRYSTWIEGSSKYEIKCMTVVIDLS